MASQIDIALECLGALEVELSEMELAEKRHQAAAFGGRSDDPIVLARRHHHDGFLAVARDPLGRFEGAVEKLAEACLGSGELPFRRPFSTRLWAPFGPARSIWHGCAHNWSDWSESKENSGRRKVFWKLAGAAHGTRPSDP